MCRDTCLCAFVNRHFRGVSWCWRRRLEGAWFSDEGSGFGVRGSGFGVWGLGFGVWGLGSGVWDLIPAISLPVLVGRGTFTWSNISRGTGKGGGRDGVMMNAALMRDGQA